MKYEDTGLDPEDAEKKEHWWIPSAECKPNTDEVVIVQVSGRPKENIEVVETQAEQATPDFMKKE